MKPVSFNQIYEQAKAALHFFAIRWSDRGQMSVELCEDKICFSVTVEGRYEEICIEYEPNLLKKEV